MYTNEISWHVESWADRLKAVQCIYRGSFAYSTCKIYQNMEIGIVLYTLETIASIRSLCILRASFSLEVWNLRRSIGCLLRQRPDSFYHSEQRFNRSFIHSFIRSFHTSLLFKRDSKMIFLNKSCSLSSSNTTEPSSRCKAPQESLKSTSTSSSMAESSSLMR